MLLLFVIVAVAVVHLLVHCQASRIVYLGGVVELEGVDADIGGGGVVDRSNHVEDCIRRVSCCC